jgi:hypothetical protein
VEAGSAAGETAVADLYTKLKVDPPDKIEADFKAAATDLALAATKTSNTRGAAAMRVMSDDLNQLVAALEAGDSTTALVTKVDKDGKAIAAACAAK